MIGKRKFLGIAVASLLVASLLGMGTALAQEAPSVSIDPADSGEVDPGGTFTIDVLVDAGDNSLKGIDVAVDYDADAMTTSGAAIVAPNLLGGLEIGPLVADGEVTYALVSTTAVADVDGSVMTITFTINDDAIAGDYDLTITKADLVDENVDPVTVSINDGTVTVSGAAPPTGASVSIDPADSGEVDPGDTFDIDVLVDAGDNSLLGIDVKVGYDADAMTTSGADIVAPDLLGGLEIGPTVTDGEVSYALVSTTAVADVDASLMTITFTMDADAAPGDYDLTITRAELVDENVEPVVVEINDGTVIVPGPSPEEAPSVSIEPDSLTAEAGGSFSVDVAVDSSGLLVKACEVEVTFDTDLTATDAIGLPLLGTPVLAIPDDNPGIAAGEVTWAVVRTGDNVPAAVEGNFMTIDFAVDAAAEGTYVLAIEATLLDENNAPITILENDGEVIVGDGVFEETFTGRLAEGDRDFICAIPAGAAALDIDLSATDDLDLELYDGATLIIGWNGEIGSAPGGSYEGDDFGYSGYSGGEEYITADGPLGQAYNLWVFAYEAGDYTVDVYYEIPAGVDVTPPTITIDVPATVSLGDEVTVTVSAADPSGVQLVMFLVSSPWPEPPPPPSSLAAPQVAYEDVIEYVLSFSDEASVTFTPGWAETYTVYAWAMDNVDNMTPDGNPETATFEVLE